VIQKLVEKEVKMNAILAIQFVLLIVWVLSLAHPADTAIGITLILGMVQLLLVGPMVLLGASLLALILPIAQLVSGGVAYKVHSAHHKPAHQV
jgi:hypothetical protein